MSIKPLADRVVIKNAEPEEKTKSGIILTGTAKEKPQVCEVVAVGPGGLVDGKEVKMTVKVGDKVLIAKYAGTEVKVDRRRVRHRAPVRHPGRGGISRTACLCKTSDFLISNSKELFALWQEQLLTVRRGP